MSILDDAIREHLELKRAHGADATELKKLEDEAFGPTARPDEPDPLAEAPTEFMATDGVEGDAAEAEPSGRRVSNVADLQEAPAPKEEAGASDEAPAEELPPAEEEHPAMEHEVVPEPAPEPADASHSTGEREAIAEQPTEHFDVEAEMESEAASPSDEELVDAEMSEPRLAPVEPLADEEEDEEAEEEEDDFFSEQRLSDELSQALDAPITDEHAAPEIDEEVEAEHEDDEDEKEDDEPPAADAGQEHEDVLEDTPDFLEDTPEDDDLWFEQRPPKDFDFDD